jgi:hypothetical protein
MNTPEGNWEFTEEVAATIERRFRAIGEARKVFFFPPWLQVVELERIHTLPDERTEREYA